VAKQKRESMTDWYIYNRKKEISNIPKLIDRTNNEEENKIEIQEMSVCLHTPSKDKEHDFRTPLSLSS
jgi:hypothetical protein